MQPIDLLIIQLLLFLLGRVSNDNVGHNKNCNKVTNYFEMSHHFLQLVIRLCNKPVVKKYQQFKLYTYSTSLCSKIP